MRDAHGRGKSVRPAESTPVFEQGGVVPEMGGWGGGGEEGGAEVN